MAERATTSADCLVSRRIAHRVKASRAVLRRSVHEAAPDSERQTFYTLLRSRGSLVGVVHQQVMLGFEEVSIWLEARSQLVDRLPLRHQPG